MEVLIVLIFISLVLVTAAVVMFIIRVRGGDFEHGERLSLLPLDEDESRAGRGRRDFGEHGPADGGEP